MITSVFVYGTLQRNQCRGNLWPRQPMAVRVAYIRGQLFDLGPYPAIRCDADDGTDCDWIAGELWTFREDEMAETMRALDRIEECNQGHANLYDRCLVRAHRLPDSADSVLAHAYQYSDVTTLDASRRIRPGQCRYVAWPVAHV